MVCRGGGFAVESGSLAPGPVLAEKGGDADCEGDGPVVLAGGLDVGDGGDEVGAFGPEPSHAVCLGSECRGGVWGWRGEGRGLGTGVAGGKGVGVEAGVLVVVEDPLFGVVPAGV